jgi:class 3 adenylate cyclase/tetratricopeptide (TPR) repeat protein
MQCPRCQHENPTGMKFCGQCAAPLASVCASCGAPNPPENKFCGQCAGPLVKSAPSRVASPESYTPRHLAEKILTSKAALEGERKLVTVLFADLKGSMELLADRDPEEARKILDPVLERMMEAVHRYEGTVNQVMGDGIMALFGAPLAHEDHAVRACYAAIRMQEVIAQYGNELRRSRALDVQIRVGLNSGEVVVRSVGSDLRMDYSAVGQTTHLAARMEQLARPGTTLMTADSLHLVEGYVQVKPLGPMPVKGLGEPAEVYELTGAGLARTRFQAAALRGLTRFVGRDAEVEHLRRVLGQAGAGHGQVVAIVGEAGVGKSRLVYEFTHSHRVQDWVVIGAASVSYGKATSYLPVIGLLKGYFRIDDRDDHREIRDKVLGRVLGLDRVLEPTLAALFSLLDLPVEDSAWQNLDPPQRRQRTLEAVKRLLLRESQVQPLLVVFEDLHWIDGETQALLDSLVESLGSARFLLLVNYRPEYEHRWGSKTYYSQLRLDSLALESTEELLGALLGPDPGLDLLRQMLTKRGNPFFLEETVRTLVETGVLAGERGSYRLTRPVDALQVPATVQTVLMARIDRLPPEEKRLLHAASVIGKDVPYAILAAIVDLPEEALRDALAHLQEAEFLYEARLFPDLEYTFKHALTHEVTYGSLLRERRQQLHARIADMIEQAHADRTIEHVERLAHHAVRGEVWGKAERYCRQAGAKAAARSAHRQALPYFDQALAALQRLPGSRVATEREIDLHFDSRLSLAPLGEHAQVFEHLRDAEALAQRIGDARRLGWVYCYMTQYFTVMGEPDPAFDAGRRALDLADQLGDFSLQVATNFFVGQTYYRTGDYQRAIAILSRNIASLQGELEREHCGIAGPASVWCRNFLVWALCEVGAFSEAAAHGRESLRIAEEVNYSYALIGALAHSGQASLQEGDFSRAIALLERGLGLCQTRDVPMPLPHVILSLGYGYACNGQSAEAVPLLAQGVEQSGSMRTIAGLSLGVGWLAEAHLLDGRVEEAVAHASRALELSRRHKERGNEAWLLRLHAEIESHPARTDLQSAESLYGQALAIADERGMRPLVAHCHLGLGKLYRQTGKSEQAHDHLVTATAMYREMDMGFWLDKAEAELATLS